MSPLGSQCKAPSHVSYQECHRSARGYTYVSSQGSRISTIACRCRWLVSLACHSIDSMKVARVVKVLGWAHVASGVLVSS